MEYNIFGNTELNVSRIGFGAWAIGGAARAGNIPIGWGPADDRESVKAIHTALDEGINFFDTADFYGLGHSEELLGKTLGNRDDVVIATKGGHRLAADKTIFTDYDPEYIRKACESSLRRLKREAVDFYQLHTARVEDLENPELINMMERLARQGKIRYWGVSLNTWDPFPEGEYMINNQAGSGIQVVFNILNQRALPLLEPARNAGLGIIARMPLQFGLLAGKFTPNTTFPPGDHRHFRLSSEILTRVLPTLTPVMDLAAEYKVTPADISLSFVLAFQQINTVIPGIRTPEQARSNARSFIQLKEQDIALLRDAYDNHYADILAEMERAEKS